MAETNRLLIVEDEPNVAITLQAILENEGYSVVTAETAAEATRLIEAEFFDAALLDLRLGDVDGIEVLREIKTKQPDCTSIMLTGYASLESAIDAIRHGAYDYLIKPVDLDELKLTIGRAVERGALSKALKERLSQLQLANATISRLAEGLQQRVNEATAELRNKVQELSNAKEQLEEEQRQREIFTLMIAHELGQPLTSILGYTKLLQRGNLPPDVLQEALDTLATESHRLSRLVHDLADISNVFGGHFRIQPIGTDLTEIVREQVNLAQMSATQRIEFNTSLDQVMAEVDPDRVAQVLSNILSNAGKYSKGETIQVSLRAENEQVFISIQDEGPGIPSEALNAVFDPHVRLTEEETKRNLSGMGLGLYIARLIAEAHGGKIGVDSKQGQGSTFTVSLPLAGAKSDGQTSTSNPNE